MTGDLEVARVPGHHIPDGEFRDETGGAIPDGRINRGAQLVVRQTARGVKQVFADRGRVYAEQAAPGRVYRPDVVVAINDHHSHRYIGEDDFDLVLLGWLLRRGLQPRGISGCTGQGEANGTRHRRRRGRRDWHQDLLAVAPVHLMAVAERLEIFR